MAESDVSSSSPTFVHRFGEFELDLARGRLFRAGVRVSLPDTQIAILVCLVAHAGQVVLKDTLVEAGWRGETVTDDSLAQAVSRLRKALDSRGRGVTSFIETVPGRGYRFTACVERAERHDAGGGSVVNLRPYRAVIQGRAALHTLNREGLRRARAAFEEALRFDRDYVPARIGLANACALIFEATRVDAVWDVETLAEAVHHARHASLLAPSSGEAWSTLAFALYLRGDTEESAVAAHRAIALEPDNWQHWLRLAFVSWGEDRIRAARHVLQLCPGLALAHWLIATVLIARGAFDAALGVLHAGCAAQDAQLTMPGSFPGVGLHLLRGLVLGAQQQFDAAADALTRELSAIDEGQMYARECAANTWYTLGALRRRQRCHVDAEHAFASALQVAPGHLSALAALGRPLPAVDSGHPRALDAALAHAAGLVRSGRRVEAAHAYRDAVIGAPLPCAGWLLPVEPVIDAASHVDAWADVLTIVRRRAV